MLSLEDTLMMDQCESDGQILLSAKIWESVDVTACCELGSGDGIWNPPLEMSQEAQKSNYRLRIALCTENAILNTNKLEIALWVGKNGLLSPSPQENDTILAGYIWGHEPKKGW